MLCSNSEGVNGNRSFPWKVKIIFELKTRQLIQALVTEPETESWNPNEKCKVTILWTIRISSGIVKVSWILYLSPFDRFAFQVRTFGHPNCTRCGSMFAQVFAWPNLIQSCPEVTDFKVQGTLGSSNASLGLQLLSFANASGLNCRRTQVNSYQKAHWRWVTGASAICILRGKEICIIQHNGQVFSTFAISVLLLSFHLLATTWWQVPWG